MRHVITILSFVVFGSSVASMLLPPIEFFNDFPRFQKVYKLVVMIVTRWAALNLRNQIFGKYFASSPTDPQLPSTKENS